MSSDLASNYPAPPILSIISPVFQAEELVDKLVESILDEVSKITDNFEIILVDDGSRDGSWKKIVENCFRNHKVKGIKLSRNFGQHYAITAGLKACAGDFVVVMDCDLQDDPKYIPNLYEKAKEGYDVVFTVKSKRHHPFWKNLTAKLFFFVFNWLSDSQEAAPDVGTLSLISRKVVDAFCKIKDSHRHYLMVLRWLGFNSTNIEIEHQKRFTGKSSYNWRRLLSHALNGITSYSDKLLKLAVGIGFLYFLVSLLAISYLVLMYFVHGYKEGWASTIVLLLFSTGIILMAIGIAGIYIGKILDQVRDRPLYLVDRKINFYPAELTRALSDEDSHKDCYDVFENPPR